MLVGSKTKNDGEIHLAMALNGSYVDLTIEDNGIGISKEDLKLLFVSSSKFRSYGTNNEKGYGLGLKLCKDFVQVNQGEVFIDSKENVGSTFTISLPMK